MIETKKIPCRVCGKLFKPCGYCQSHTDVFRWRNFACSKECAQKYISDTAAYRETQHKNKHVGSTVASDTKEEVTVEKEKAKKTYKKKSIDTRNIDTVIVDLEENDKNKETD